MHSSSLSFFQQGLGLVLPSRYWNYRCAPQHPASLQTIFRVLWFCSSFACIVLSVKCFSTNLHHPGAHIQISAEIWTRAWNPFAGDLYSLVSTLLCPPAFNTYPPGLTSHCSRSPCWQTCCFVYHQFPGFYFALLQCWEWNLEPLAS